MKDVLIYGALIAAVLGVGANLIGNFRTTISDMGSAVNTQITQQQTALVDAIGGTGN